MNRIKPTLHPLKLDPKLTVREALERVLRLPSVASKRYLTNKVSFIILRDYLTATLSIVCLKMRNVTLYVSHNI